MTWAGDPELQEMFVSELEARTARLVEGGRAMVSGELDEDMIGTMVREGHTIKGTGRVMGYEAVSVAGQQLEALWRRVQTGELQASETLGHAVVGVSEVLVAAGAGDPEAGTPELVDAMAALDAALGTGSAAAKPKLRAVEAPDIDSENALEASPEVVRAAEPYVEESAGRDEPGDHSVAFDLPEPADDEAPDEDDVDQRDAGHDVIDDVVGESGADPAEDIRAVFPDRASRVDEGGLGLRARIAAAAAAEEEPVDDEPAGVPADVPAAPAAASAAPSQPEDDFTHEHVRPRRPQPIVVEPAPLQPARSEPPAAASITADLGGLLGAVESWASVETLPVSAGRMYRLINLVARIRIDLEAADGKLRAVRNSDDLEALENGFTAILNAANELEHDAMQLAAIPLSSMTNTLPQLVRFVAKKLGKEVRFEIVGDTEIAVDRQVLDKIADPLRQLVVNAITHGIEPADLRTRSGKTATGSVSLTATVKDRRVELVISDDGGGVDWGAVRSIALERGILSQEDASDPAKLNDALFSPGFSTGDKSDMGGTGKGLSAVAEVAEALFGRVRLESALGTGTSVTMTVPTSRALQRVMIFESAGMQWGIPEAVVDEVLPISEAPIDWSGDQPVLEWRGERIGVVPLGEIVGATESSEPAHVIVVSHRIGNAAITVSGAHGIREVAAKELGPLLSGPSHVTGAALLGGGDVVLVLDAATIVANGVSPVAIERAGDRVLVVDDSIGARAVVSGALASSGFTTSVAASAAEALDILAVEDIDALVVDFSMPQEDGAQLVKKIRDRGITVPVVMLSGVASEEDKARSKDAGVDVFFDKADFREGALAETLREMLAQG